MVRSHLSRSLHTSVPELNDSKDHSSQNRGRRNRSPGPGHTNHGSSPKRNSSWRPSPSERKGGDDSVHPRLYHRRDNTRDFHRPNDSSMPGHRHSNAANNGRNQIKRSKWRRNRNKKKRRKGAGKGGPPLSGANCAPVSGNRQPIASMRMRMDDYATPRTGRLLPLNKGNDIEHAVARARREASTRTKDTFWTKKLLDAESSHPNRWAHSGFKELYREELGYSEMDYKEREKGSSRRSPPSRGTKRPRSPQTTGKPRSRERYSTSRKAAKSKSDSRLKGAKSPPGRKFSKSRSRSKSHSRSPRGRKRIRLNPPLAGAGRKSSYLKPNKRSFSRSLSRSPSSISSGSHSDSRSYSSYSRSSSRSSSTTSSTFSSSTSGSISFRRGRRRRSYSRSSKSWSRSPSPARPPPRRPPKIKTASLSRAVQSVHAGKEKAKPLTKTVANEPSKAYYAHPEQLVGTVTNKPKTKKVRPVPPETTTHHRRHGSPIAPPPSSAHRPPAGDFYEKEVQVNKGTSSTFPEPIEKVTFGADPRRTAGSEPTVNFKVPLPSGGLATHHHETGGVQAPGGTRSEGEQSNSESSSDEDELPLRMTLSERFGKLAQLSSQRQEYEGVRMKIVREGGQDKKVYLEGGASRSPSPTGRRTGGSNANPAHERWLREHKAEYDEYEERYGEFRHWDPHRDLPRELPPNWDDVNVRYRYYKESGYFGERSITMEDYLKWEEWWYRYRDWLEKYGGVQEENLKYRAPYAYDVGARTSTRERWMRREGHRDKEGGRKRHRY